MKEMAPTTRPSSTTSGNASTPPRRREWPRGADRFRHERSVAVIDAVLVRESSVNQERTAPVRECGAVAMIGVNDYLTMWWRGAARFAKASAPVLLGGARCHRSLSICCL